MNFTLTEEEAAIQQLAREFADKELAPVSAKIDRDHRVPRDILAKMADLGFMGMLAPEEVGGAGLNNFCMALVQMEINRACASTGVAMSVHNSLAQSPLLKFATEEQKRRYLPKLTKAEWIGAYSLSEPECGTDSAALITRAVRDGKHYVVNGTKNFVTNGGIADLFIVFVRTNPDVALKHKGISALIVERSTKGFTVGKDEKKMGIRGSSTVSLFFEDARVPAENLLGVENDGFKIAMNTLDGGRIGIACQAVGIAQASLDASLKYAKERRQFDRPIADFQAIQWKLADLATEIDAAKLLVLRAARLRDQGVPHTREASMAKLFASEMANRHATQAVQIHGGNGYIRDFPVERYFRDARITTIYEGTSEAQRMVIARQMLR
ncbi:MAG: acyl-CoA dehydrogenase [Planctomycetes bacterium]|nr:acyl-CoA dehydrogenase [Planctomycetota bacterium]